MNTIAIILALVGLSSCAPWSQGENRNIFVMSETDRNENSQQATYMAIPISQVNDDSKILADHQGKPLLVQPANNSEEEMMTADSLVYRPLFAYRKQVAKRQRINSGDYPHTPTSRRVYYMHGYYPQYYRKPARYPVRKYREEEDEDRFPVLI
ncbi:PREDICTED: uncharacterized protein LOC108559199 [Nicrophorus vespilloides]|uniref:Uncharacterized protein LOC108559199 n=1 Tax=Nicrophorus vespilloides TaxID=110193 RepID=A0ABM1MBC2_NICVS|nr:PREDICTED: uncharacterized protein LOC108559199 [Nicrophorus vespilloides]